MNQGIWIGEDCLERQFFYADLMYEWITKYGSSKMELGHLIYYHTLAVL